MLALKNGSQERVLTVKMIIERALGDLRRGGDLIDTDPRIPPAAEFPIGGVENALARDGGGSRHAQRIVAEMYTD